MRPLNRGLVCVVGDLEWSLDFVVRVSEAGFLEEVGRFDDGRSDDVKSRPNSVTPVRNTWAVVSRNLKVM